MKRRNEPDEVIDGERRQSEAAGRRGMSAKHKVIGYSLATVGVVGFVLWRDPTKKTVAEDTRPVTQIGETVHYEPGPPLPKAEPAPDLTLREALRQAAQAAAETTKAQTQASPPANRMLVYGGGEARPPSQPAAVDPAAGSAGRTPAIPGTTVSFKGGEIPGLKAGAAIDDTLVLMPGVTVCILDNAIDTTQPGPIFCHTKSTERSPKNIPLMEAGTKIVGSYSSSISQGQARMPAVSAFAFTPNGVPVSLGATMGDALGRAGFPGEVDNHTLERFGGALLLLGTQGAISVAQAAVQKGSNNLNLNTGTLEGAITESLRNTVNIPVTIKKNQGDEVAILRTVPIDFSASYRLGMAR